MWRHALGESGPGRLVHQSKLDIFGSLSFSPDGDKLAYGRAGLGLVEVVTFTDPAEVIRVGDGVAGVLSVLLWSDVDLTLTQLNGRVSHFDLSKSTSRAITSISLNTPATILPEPAGTSPQSPEGWWYGSRGLGRGTWFEHSLTAPPIRDEHDYIRLRGITAGGGWTIDQDPSGHLVELRRAPVERAEPKRLMERLWSMTPVCLSVERRMSLLGQQQSEAQADHTACVERVQRAP